MGERSLKWPLLLGVLGSLCNTWFLGSTRQERPQDFGFLGVNPHLPPEEKKILKI